jgi:hypothetical protein
MVMMMMVKERRADARKVHLDTLREREKQAEM